MPKTLPFFFPSVIYPLYLHVIIDFGHIWGHFMAEIEKMCQKSAFLVVPDFLYVDDTCHMSCMVKLQSQGGAEGEDGGGEGAASFGLCQPLLL